MTEDTRGRHDDGKLLYCSFCGKSQHEVRKLIAGPSVFVCDECVELCNDIIREELEDRADSLPREPPPVAEDVVPQPHPLFSRGRVYGFASLSALWGRNLNPQCAASAGTSSIETPSPCPAALP